MTLCTVDGCDRPHSARGLCRTHYWRLRHHHTTSDDMPITRHTRPETLCPVCLQLIPDRAVAPIHPDSTGVQTNTSASYTYKFEFPDDLQPENEAK